MSERPPKTEPEIVELVRAIDVPAPQELHRRIDALIAERAPAARRAPAPLRFGVAGALALAVIAVALVVGLSGGGGGSTLTLRSAVALTLRSPTMPAPTQDPHNATELAADVEGVAFPYWEDSFGWRAAGARADQLDGRKVTTVFYARGHSRWIGYAIVAGAAPRIGGGVVREREGTSYRFSSVDGASVVTWRREGHLCVVAGHGVDEATLMALASWRERGTLTA
jgi:hypothetical protein